MPTPSGRGLTYKLLTSTQPSALHVRLQHNSKKTGRNSAETNVELSAVPCRHLETKPGPRFSNHTVLGQPLGCLAEADVFTSLELMVCPLNAVLSRCLSPRTPGPGAPSSTSSVQRALLLLCPPSLALPAQGVETFQSVPSRWRQL